ncbi:GDSL-type esterase/lipase family protein [Corynebacterium pseudokroppenstedtii]|uniref:GDSL-type esterase/lipase family protein n=1 Tax=Corynebacterium pseudokroppenstedtii TaxID=2804917 RepID=A0AAU0Q1M1_9CORY
MNNPDPEGRTLHQRLVDIANNARQRSPHAKIVFTGYYTAAMKDYQCIDDGFLSDNDRAFLEQYVTNINNVVKSAAQDTNATYVTPPNQPDGWCSPANERNSSYFGIPEGSLIAHPTHTGQQRMAQTIANQL